MVSLHCVSACYSHTNGELIVPGTLVFIVSLETLEHTHKECYYVGNVHHSMQPCREVSMNES